MATIQSIAFCHRIVAQAINKLQNATIPPYQTRQDTESSVILALGECVCIDDVLLDVCLQKAWEYQTLTLPNPAVGALVYDEDGEILSLQAHKKAGLPHAEVLALLYAFARLVAKYPNKAPAMPPCAYGDSRLDSATESLFAHSILNHSAFSAPESTSIHTPIHTSENNTNADTSGYDALSPLYPLLCEFFHTTATATPPTLHALCERLCADSHAIHSFLSTYHNAIFAKTTLILTLEPCNHFGKTPPCAQLIATLKPKKVVIGARDIWGESAQGAIRLEQVGIEVALCQSTALRQKAQDLLYPFLAYRECGGFSVFKLASRLDGDYKSGQISASKSQAFTHNQRSIATSIIISGACARGDRPRLDTRYATPPYAPHPTSKSIQNPPESTSQTALEFALDSSPASAPLDSKAPKSSAIESTPTQRLPNVGIFTRDASSIDRNIPLFAPNRTIAFYTPSNFLCNFLCEHSEIPAPSQTPHHTLHQTPRHAHCQDSRQICATPPAQKPHIKGFHIVEGGLSLYRTLVKIPHYRDMPKLLLLHLSTTLAPAHAIDSTLKSLESSTLDSAVATPNKQAQSEQIQRFSLLHATQLDTSLDSTRCETDLLLWLQPLP